MRAKHIIDTSSNILDGADLLRLMTNAEQLLQENAELVNQLNVFPVPDGDTGTNMLLTLKSALFSARQEQVMSAENIAEAVAKGALLGAKGNSGVILSQFLRGFANGLKGKYSFTVKDLADALKLAKTCAYQAVAEPVEGTLLTVIRRVAQAAQRVAKKHFSMSEALRVLSSTAKRAVAETPRYLAVLREAEVVDAGGQGLLVIIEGLHRAISPNGTNIVDITPKIKQRVITVNSSVEHDTYGYCTNFLLTGDKLDTDILKAELVNMGQSLVAVGDEQQFKVHIHTLDPGAILSHMVKFGHLSQIQIDNMDNQAQAKVAREMNPVQVSPSKEVAIIAVAWGKGIIDIFNSLSVHHIIHAGDSMNPSIQDILQEIEATQAAKVIVLPNNPNIIAAAEQAAKLANREVRVVPTKTIPQGIAATMAFVPTQEFSANDSAMREAIFSIKSGAVTIASRSVKLGGVDVKQGQFIALLENKLVASADTLETVVLNLLETIKLNSGQLITCYAGSDITEATNQQLSETIKKIYPQIDLEFVWGGQPYYQYFIAIE
jgi:DAK2 domain fusion protein YloV